MDPMGPVFVSHIWRIIECDTWSLLPPRLKPQAVRVSANLKTNQWEPNGGFNIFFNRQVPKSFSKQNPWTPWTPAKNTPNHTTSTSQDKFGLQMNFLQLAVPKLDVSTNLYGNLGCNYKGRFFATSVSYFRVSFSFQEKLHQMWAPEETSKASGVAVWVTRGSVGLCCT